MKKIFLMFSLVLLPLIVMGAPLNKEDIINYLSVGKEMDKLELKYPEASSQIDDFSLSQSEKIIEQMKASPIYPDFKIILSKNGFHNLEEYLNIITRVMGGIYAASMSSMPEGMNFDVMIQKQEEALTTMKKDARSPQMYTAFETSLNEMKKTRDTMNYSMKIASTEDKKFVKDNFQWITNQMPQEEE